MTYTYNGNQLTKVEDATGNTFGFANGVSQTTEYFYDSNGNLTKDSNKGIASITYNSLNLPSVVTFSDGNTITYTYSADGRKLRTVHVISGTTTTTDYCGNVLYENGVAKTLLTEAGYVDLTDNSHHFYIKDHLGNNRIVADASGTVEESNQYYPFGLLFANSNSNLQPYKYNGKELDTKAVLNWYDYGARHYDAALGRWHVVDPLAEKYYSTSPYAYCLNNPVKLLDPDGRRVRPSNPVRRGYRNAGRPNPYAFYPLGVQPQSYRTVSKISYKGNGLREKISMGEQKYVENVTVGDNTVPMTRDNVLGNIATGGIGLLYNIKESQEQMLKMSTETVYSADGKRAVTSNYTILDEGLATAQAEYTKKYNALSEQLGDNLSILEKNALIQKEIGISPLMTILMDMIMNPTNYEVNSNREIIPEFRQKQ